MRAFRRGRRQLAAVLLACLGVAGCTMAPEALTEADRLSEATADRQSMYADNVPLTKPLTLQDAFQRALAYNLDARVKAREVALAENALDLSRLDMLPKLGVDGALTARNNQDASSSEAVATGQQSLVVSTSTDRRLATGDLALSWNVLDLGISYYAAHQQGNRILFAEEQRRKVVQTLEQDVRRAFWRAVAAQRLSGQIAHAIHAAQNALPEARKVETEGLRSPVDSLRYQKALLEAISQLETVQHGLEISKLELASLINLPPGQPYTLAVPPDRSIRLHYIRLPITEMEQTALILNPDIRAQSYDVRITADDAHLALLRLLPGINLSVSPNYDSNSFLLHQHWVTGAARVTGNLMDLVKIPATTDRSEQSIALATQRRQAVSAAVLTKLHISSQEYVSAAAEYRTASQLADVDQRLYQQVSNQTATDVQGDLERVSTQVGAVFSRLRQYQSYAEAQAALGRLYATLGVDPPADHLDQLDIAEIGEQVRKVATHIDVNEPAAKQTADPQPAPGKVASSTP